MGEAACDARMMTFLACVRAVRDQTPGGFSAVKLTALGDPVLLSQLTTCVHVREFKLLFSVFVVNCCYRTVSLAVSVFLLSDIFISDRP